jgi:hypothetical protein
VRRDLVNYLRTLGLAAVAATALMVFVGAGTALAETTVCKTIQNPCPAGWALQGGETIDATLSGSTIMETTGGAVLQTCTGGTIKGTVAGAGVATTPTGSVEPSGLTWGVCTRTTDTIQGGSIQLHANGDATHTGTIKARHISVTVSTVSFGSCTFGLGSLNEYSDIGTVTSSTPGVIHINALLPKEAGGCPNQIRWTATYNVTTPGSMTILP